MIHKQFIKTCDDIKSYDGASLKQLEYAKKLGLPREHIEFLSISNGLEFYGGYYRLFGLDTSQKVNLLSWNDHNKWIDVWGEYASGYYFFGMSAIGDLFAYQLINGSITNEIYYLDGTTMDAIDLYNGFTDFFKGEFIERYKGIMEEILVSARQKFGDLDSDTSLIYSPSLFLVNNPSVENLMKMPTFDVMTINGDLCRQLINTKEPVKSLEQYIDEHGRARIKVIFGNERTKLI